MPTMVRQRNQNQRVLPTNSRYFTRATGDLRQLKRMGGSMRPGILLRGCSPASSRPSGAPAPRLGGPCRLGEARMSQGLEQLAEGARVLRCPIWLQLLADSERTLGLLELTLPPIGF